MSRDGELDARAAVRTAVLYATLILNGEAVAAPSRGRQARSCRATAAWSREARIRGLTPTAKCCHRFAISAIVIHSLWIDH